MIAPLSSVRMPAFSSSLWSSPHESRCVLVVAVEGWVGAGLALAGQQQLEAVVPRIDELVEADDPARVLGPPAADARHQGIVARELPQQLTGALGNSGIVGALDDRRQRSIDVEEETRSLRVLTQSGERFGRFHVN